MAIDDDVLRTLKPEPIDAIKGRVRDGDLLLCSGNDAFFQADRLGHQTPLDPCRPGFSLAGPGPDHGV